MNRIAYLAPEIPALSATFVYNEIIALQERDFEVIPISVHIAAPIVLENRVEKLRIATRYLYRKGILDLITAALSQLWTTPRSFFWVASMVFRDAFAVGITTRIGVGLFYRFLAACRVARILCQEKCDHLHAHFAHVPTDIAMYAAALAGIPFSFTAHANDLFERRWLLSEKIARCKFAVTISEFNRDFMVARGGDRRKINIVRCSIDPSRFTPVPVRPLTPPYVIGTIGRMVEKKGFDTLLQSVALLRCGGIEIRLTIAGSGPMELELFSIAQSLGLVGIVDFPGPMAHDRVPDLLRALDLFVLPCQQDVRGDMDGIPVVLMEAMAVGVPVVSTCISGIPELIMHRCEGLLVAPRSPVALAEAITELLFNYELRESCSGNGRQKIMREFDAEVNLARLTRLFTDSNR